MQDGVGGVGGKCGNLLNAKPHLGVCIGWKLVILDKYKSFP